MSHTGRLDTEVGSVETGGVEAPRGGGDGTGEGNVGQERAGQRGELTEERAVRSGGGGGRGQEQSLQRMDHK